MGRIHRYLILLDEGIGGKGGDYFFLARKVLGYSVKQYEDMDIPAGTLNGDVRDDLAKIAMANPSVRVIFLTSDRDIPAQQPPDIPYILVVFDTKLASTDEFKAHLKAFKSVALASNRELENGMHWQATRRSEGERMSPNQRFCNRLPDVDFPPRPKHDRRAYQVLPSAVETVRAALDIAPVEVGRDK